MRADENILRAILVMRGDKKINIRYFLHRIWLNSWESLKTVHNLVMRVGKKAVWAIFIYKLIILFWKFKYSSYFGYERW